MTGVFLYQNFTGKEGREVGGGTTSRRATVPLGIGRGVEPAIFSGELHPCPEKNAGSGGKGTFTEPEKNAIMLSDIVSLTGGIFREDSK